MSLDKDYTSYHLLLALREKHKEAYKKVAADDKAAILCSALASLVYFNDWGYLHPREPYDGEAAGALVEVGKPAIPYLKQLLGNREPAPCFGSEIAPVSYLYQFRRADFAYRYLSLILGRSPTFHRRIADRDRDIAALKEQLGQGQGAGGASGGP